MPRRRLTLKDRLAELDAKIARARTLMQKLMGRREDLAEQVRAKAKADLEAVGE